ncbi:MAG: hypothetical protein V4574_21835 [Pseudomonadota bacterium]
MLMIGACALASLPAQAQVRGGYTFDRDTARAMTCFSMGIDQPGPYTMYLGYAPINGKKPSYYNAFQWRGPRGRVVTFVGLGSSDGAGWWFGTLNGKQAAGHNLNRKHFVFSTSDTKLEFECWEKGWQHGSY